MKTKTYEIEEESTTMVAEPAVVYGTTTTRYGRSVASRPPLHISSKGNKESEWIANNYERLLSEAHQKYGKKERMTPEEYFGKLKYMVNAYYDSVQGQD